MKSQEKKRILILILVAAIILVLVWFITRNTKSNKNPDAQQGTSQSQAQIDNYDGPLTQTGDDGLIKNISPKFSQERELEGFKISNISLTKGSNGFTKFTADVTNKSGKAQGNVKVDIVVYDRNGNELGKMPAVITETKAGETIEVRAEINIDLVSAFDFKIVKK